MKNNFSLQCDKWSSFLLWIFHYFMYLLQAWEKGLVYTPSVPCPPPSSLLSSFASLLLFYFILYLIVVYISIINLFLVQLQIFLLLHFWFSASSSCGGKWMKGCVVLSCWLGLHRVILKMFSLFRYSAKLCCLPCFQPFREPRIWDRTRLVGKIFKFL